MFPTSDSDDSDADLRKGSQLSLIDSLANGLCEKENLQKNQDAHGNGQ